jgi:ammonia channel protein AmtB
VLSAPLTCFVWVFVCFFVFFKILDAVLGNRVSAEVELEGLDTPEMGALAYPTSSSRRGPTRRATTEH